MSCSKNSTAGSSCSGFAGLIPALLSTCRYGDFGCSHGAEVAEALGWMLRVGEAFLVAELAAALVDGGGLVLASDPPVTPRWQPSSWGDHPPITIPAWSLSGLEATDATLLLSFCCAQYLCFSTHDRGVTVSLYTSLFTRCWG